MIRWEYIPCKSKIDSIEKLAIVIGAAKRKYTSTQEETALYGLGRYSREKLLKDFRARRRISGRIIVNMQKPDEYIATMSDE